MFIPKLKLNCLKMLESSIFEAFSLFLISLYTIFILFWLTLADFFPMLTEEMLSLIDSVFLTLFFVEIVLKSFASNLGYLLDFFNAFDAVIVLASEILNLYGIIAKGLGVLRLIRVAVITVRKISGKQSRLRHASKNLNPVESVITILQQVTEIDGLSSSLK